MAKSKEQKRKEALERGRAHYYHHVDGFMLFSPLQPRWDQDLEDFCFWLGQLHTMRKVSFELDIHYDGTDTYSSDMSWTTEEVVNHLFASKEIIRLHINMKKFVERQGKECRAFDDSYDNLAKLMPVIEQMMAGDAVKEHLRNIQGA